MSDFPTLDAMRNPWREPGLYCGQVEVIPPSLAYDGGQTGTLTIRAGWSAAEKRRPWRNCHDSAAVWGDPDESVCLLAIADGVGEEDGAGKAARAATVLGVRAFREKWNAADTRQRSSLESLLTASFRTLNSTLADRASREARGRDFRTTLILAAVPARVSPGGSVGMVVARVGDSMAWRVRAGSLEPLFELAEPRPGAVSRTYALPGHLDELEVRKVSIADGEVLALTTDGLAAGVRNERSRDYLASLWATPPTPVEFLRSLAVRRDDRDDDRAAAVVWVGSHEIVGGA